MRPLTDSSPNLPTSSEHGTIKEFTNVATDVTLKKQEKFIPIKVVTAHAKLKGADSVFELKEAGEACCYDWAY
jgi:hypothetical protein